jgi:hypothetical protein
MPTDTYIINETSKKRRVNACCGPKSGRFKPRRRTSFPAKKNRLPRVSANAATTAG